MTLVALREMSCTEAFLEAGAQTRKCTPSGVSSAPMGILLLNKFWPDNGLDGAVCCSRVCRATIKKRCQTWAEAKGGVYPKGEKRGNIQHPTTNIEPPILWCNLAAKWASD